MPEFVSALLMKNAHDKSFRAIYGIVDQSIIKPEDAFEVGLGVLAMVYQHFRNMTAIVSGQSYTPIWDM